MAAEKYKLFLYMFITLPGSPWLPMSKYCGLIVKLSICPSHGHYMNSKLLPLSGGRYVAALSYTDLVVYVYHFVSSYWRRQSSIYCDVAFFYVVDATWLQRYSSWCYICLRRFLHNQGNIATEGSPKSGLYSSLIEWLQGFLKVHSIP